MKTTTESGARRYYLDWLRVIAIFSVFVFHSLHFFDPGDWSIKNPTTYSWVGWVMKLIGFWMMPMVFLISGASLYYAIGEGSAIGFIKDKVLRLLVPLLVGVFTFSIIQVYLERLTHGQFQGTLFDFLPHYFDGIYLEGGTGNFAFHGMHLWYLLFLFVYTIVLMPLFWWFKSATGERAVRRLGDVLALPGAIVLLAVPTVVLRTITQNGGLGGNFGLGNWEPVQYVWFFLAGYLILAHERLQQRIIQARWVCLAVAVVMAVFWLALHSSAAYHPDLIVWPMLFAFLGFAMKHLTYSNPFLSYANEAVLPFYILHQNVLLWVGFFVVSWTVPDVTRYFIIAGGSFGIILLLYEYLVRHFNVMRVLFGMKPLRHAPAPAGQTPVMRPT